MTDLPFGRGGSPLQNLIVRGHSETVLTALRMTEELDAGPVYLKTRLNLDGSASEIYGRAADLVFDLIGKIVADQPTPKPQQGEVVSFERRKPEDSRLPQRGSLEQLFDHIRMLDAETYPTAFIDSGDYRLEFENAKLDDGVLRAQVAVRIRTDESKTQKG
jgi:methionyl-tRNA formyltransferase